MGRLAGCALALVALLAAATPAGAASTPSSLSVVFAGEVGPGSNTAVIGQVTSSNRRCLSGRTVEVSVTKPGGEIPVDVARSGKNGGWYARGPTELLNGATAINLKLEPRKLGTGPGAVRCAGAKAKLT